MDEVLAGGEGDDAAVPFPFHHEVIHDGSEPPCRGQVLPAQRIVDHRPGVTAPGDQNLLSQGPADPVGRECRVHSVPVPYGLQQGLPRPVLFLPIHGRALQVRLGAGGALLVHAHLVTPRRIRLVRVLDHAPGVEAPGGGHFGRGVDDVVGGRAVHRHQPQVRFLPDDAVLGSGVAHEVSASRAAVHGGVGGEVPHLEELLFPVVEDRPPELHRVAFPGAVGHQYRIAADPGRILDHPAESGTVLHLFVVQEEMQPRVVEFPSSLDPFGVGRRPGLVRGRQDDQENDCSDGADGTEIWFPHNFLEKSGFRPPRTGTDGSNGKG